MFAEIWKHSQEAKDNLKTAALLHDSLILEFLPIENNTKHELHVIHNMLRISWVMLVLVYFQCHS